MLCAKGSLLVMHNIDDGCAALLGSMHTQMHMAGTTCTLDILGCRPWFVSAGCPLPSPVTLCTQWRCRRRACRRKRRARWPSWPCRRPGRTSSSTSTLTPPPRSPPGPWAPRAAAPRTPPWHPWSQARTVTSHRRNLCIGWQPCLESRRAWWCEHPALRPGLVTPVLLQRHACQACTITSAPEDGQRHISRRRGGRLRGWQSAGGARGH